MKLRLTLFLAACTLLHYGELVAQTPEFGLTMSLSTNQNGGEHRHITFGYDPKSYAPYLDTNLFDTTFYHQLPTAFDAEWDLLDPGDTLYFDRYILPKPTADSFTLVYTWLLNWEDYPDTIRWNPNLIPAIIKHIYLISQAAPSIIQHDLTKESSMVLGQDSLGLYTHATVELLYNEEVPTAVASTSGPSSGLLNGTSAYPNPYESHSSVQFTLTKQASVKLIMYDETGRIIEERSFVGHPGLNIVTFNLSGSPHGPVYARVEATSGETREAASLTLLRR